MKRSKICMVLLLAIAGVFFTVKSNYTKPKIIKVTVHEKVVVVDNKKLDSLQYVIDRLSSRQARLEREQKEIDQELTEIFD